MFPAYTGEPVGQWGVTQSELLPLSHEAHRQGSQHTQLRVGRVGGCTNRSSCSGPVSGTASPQDPGDSVYHQSQADQQVGWDEGWWGPHVARHFPRPFPTLGLAS